MLIFERKKELVRNIGSFDKSSIRKIGGKITVFDLSKSKGNDFWFEESGVSNNRVFGKSGFHCIVKLNLFWGLPLIPTCMLAPGRGYFPKNWVGLYGALLETLTLFQTKICDFPYSISDLTQNLVPYFRPDAKPISFA